MNKLIEITKELEPSWKEHCDQYGKIVAKEVRKILGFWEYYFTNKSIESEFIMLNTSFADGIRKGEIKFAKEENDLLVSKSEENCLKKN